MCATDLDSATIHFVLVVKTESANRTGQSKLVWSIGQYTQTFEAGLDI